MMISKALRSKQGLFAAVFVLSVVSLLYSSIAGNGLIFNDLLVTSIVGVVAGWFGWSLVQEQLKQVPYVLGGMAISYFIIARLYSTTMTPTELLDSPDWAFLIVASIFVGAGLSQIWSTQPVTARPSRPWLDIVLVLLLLFFACVQLFTNSGSRNFQNDEFLQLEAAVGYLNTGEFVRWNFTENAPVVDQTGDPVQYTRSAPMTWQIAMSMKLFGQEEWAARLPAQLWFIAFILFAYGVARAWSKDALFAFLLTTIFVFADHLILQGRFVRMYSMLLCVSSVAMLFWFKTFQYSLKSHARIVPFLFWLASTGAVSIIALLTHSVFALFFPGFGVFIALQLLMVMRNKNNTRERRRILYWASGLVGIGILGAIIFFFEVGVSSSFIGLRSSVQQSYEVLPFIDSPLPLLLLPLFVGGVVLAWKEKNAAFRFIATISVVALVLFLFVIQRYNAFRYVLFLVPLFTAIAFVLWYRVLHWWAGVLPQPARALAIAVLTIAVLVPLSWPSLGVTPLTTLARADYTNSNGYGHDFETAYHYIRDARTDREVVFGQSFRSYYWQEEPGLPLIDLGEERSLHAEEFQVELEMHTEAWFVWAEGKTHHIRPAVLRRIEEVAVAVHECRPELENTNMRVYYYNQTSQRNPCTE